MPPSVPAGRLTADDVGRRVTVRRLLPDEPPLPDGRPPLGDVVGILESWHEGILRVRRRGGDLVAVPEHAVVLGRVVVDRGRRGRSTSPGPA